MRVYFAGAIMGGRQNLPIYQHIVARLQAAGCLVPSEHVADPAVLAHETACSPREVYERDMAWIKECDAMVAEVSTPSLGVGYEVACALQRGLPVLCLYQRELSVSKMITGNSALTLRVVTFADLDELDAHLDSFLSSIRPGTAHA